MESINSITLSQFPFEQAQKVADLLYYDEPILSHYKFKEIDIIKYLVDYDDYSLRYLVFQIEKYDLYKLITGNISLRDTLIESLGFSPFLYLTDVDIENDIHLNTYQVTFDTLSPDYLPLSGSFVEQKFSKLEVYKEIMKIYSDTYYIEQLKERAYYVKFEPISQQYDSSLGIVELSKLLNLLTTSFKNFTKIDFFKFFDDKIADKKKLNNMYNQAKSFADSRAVDFNFGSFEIGIAVDKIMKKNVPHKEVAIWLNEVEEKFKRNVLELNYNNEDAVDEIIKLYNYTPEEIEKIYNPIMKISQDIDYSFEYKDSKFENYKEISVTNKKVIIKLSPIPVQKVMEEEELNEIEYYNIIVPKAIGKKMVTKINLENTLFTQTDEFRLTNANFEEYDYVFLFDISIDVKLSSINGHPVLNARYDETEFISSGDKSNNLKALSKKLIEKIAEYIYEREKSIDEFDE